MNPARRKLGEAVSAETVKRIIHESVTREQFIDVCDLLRATRKAAGEHAIAMGLAGRSALQIAGFGAHALQNIKLPELTVSQGGTVIDGGNFPGTELRSFQPICCYGRVLFGKASISDPGEFPSRNATRINGAKVNVLYATTAFLPGLEPPPPAVDVIYVLLLTCRDRNDPSKYQHMAIAALEPNFSGFIFYQDLEQFIADYGDVAVPGHAEPAASESAAPLGLRLKEGVAPYEGSEGGDEASNNKLP